MRLLGFNFDKISIERLADISQDLKLETKIDVLEISKAEADFLNEKDTLLGIKFGYSINYEPKIASINLKGNLVLAVEPKLAKKVIEEWEANRKVSEEVITPLFNLILRKVNVRAIQLEDEFGLPLSIPLPRFSPKKEESDEKTRN